jgi:hypothetical protein
MNSLNGTGYDAAQAHREEDDLDRWRFAAEIVEVLLATPPDWSARIGVFGKWGEGKSTVLRFAEKMLKEKENLVFWFNPWAIQDWENLWEEFGDRLTGALKAAQIPFEGEWKKAAKDLGKKLESKGVGGSAETIAAALGREKAWNSAFGLVSRWLKYDGAQIHRIQEKLQGRRLIVLIDDLDRCAPELLPRLLLSLRELLDLPGFSFLLAFDDEIVARALAQENPAWLAGSNFLEKVLDFSFHIPPVTDSQKERFVFSAVNKYCPFVPIDSAKQILDLLPNNPRKLKALIRSMSSLRPQVDRHDPDELNWVDIWLAQMLRLESNAFFERLLENNTLDKETGAFYRIITAREKTGDRKNESLRHIIVEAGVKDATLEQRLIRLIEAVRARASTRFPYLCGLALRPHAVTWKEFRSFYALWTSDPGVETVFKWVKQHAIDRNISFDDVETELFETMLVRRDECLSIAAESPSLQEHDLAIDEAGKLLDLIEQDLLQPNKLGASRFKRLYGQASYWIGFRKNASDNALRDKEEALLLKLLSSASDELSTDLLEVMLRHFWHPEVDEGFAQKKILQSKCEAIAGPKAAKEAINFFTREGGIKSLYEIGRFRAVKYCLLNPESPVWRAPLQDILLELIRKGRDEFVIYENVRDFFTLLVQGLQGGVDTVARKDIVAVLSDRTFVQRLWETVTSRGIQYRMQIAFIRSRDALIENGIPAASLPLTEELSLRAKESKNQSNQQDSAAAGNR